MAVLLSPVGGVAGQFFDNNGNPLTGGKLYSYVAGTTTPQVTYTSSAGTVAHSNPIILDAGGRVPGGEIWLTDGLQYKFVLKNANDVLIGTYDNIIGINSNFVNFLTETEVQTATAGQTVFTLTTMQYQPGTNNLSVFVDGVNQIDGSTYSYVETSSTVITFTAGLHVGALVKFTTAQTLSTGVTDASLVTYTPAGTGAVATTVQTKLRQIVSVMDFGAVGDGVVDDTVAIQAAITYTGSTGTVDFPSGIYRITGVVNMPMHTSGNFTVAGNVQWADKTYATQQGAIRVEGSVLIDNLISGNFTRIVSTGDVTIQSSNSLSGTFWNDFGSINCQKLTIDVDQGQSVNQNIFQSCRTAKGLHIKGVATSGIREAHNNLFVSLDTTGANMTATDGTTGIHILNDSNLNQTNTVSNWYAEISGSRLVYGNWNILGDNVDAVSPSFLGNRENFRLGARLQGRQSSFLPVAIQSQCRGGDWSEVLGNGKPVKLGGTGSVVQLSAISTNASLSPDGATQGWQSTGGATFRAIDFNYLLGTSGRVSMTAYVYQEGTPVNSCEIYGGGVLQTSGAASYTSLGNNWYLLRVSGISKVIDPASGYLEGYIRLYTTGSAALTAADFRIVTSYFVSTEAIAPLPSLKIGQKVGFSTAAPTAGAWTQSDLCWNTAVAAGGVPGWVCVTTGIPGTWKAMAAVAA